MLRISEDRYAEIQDEFYLHAAETGRDREACFAPEDEIFDFVSDTLGTEDWVVI